MLEFWKSHSTRAALASVLLAVLIMPSGLCDADAQQKQTLSSSPSQQFQDWLKSLATSGAKVTTNDIQYDQTADVITVKGLTVASTTTTSPTPQSNAAAISTELKVSLLTMKGFSVTRDGAHFGSAAADDISILNANSPKNSGTSVSHLELSDSFLPDFSAFKADPTRPVSTQIGFLRLLSKAKFNAVSVSKLQFGGTFSVDKATLSGISNGTMSTVAIDGVRGTFPPAETATPNDQNTPGYSVDSIAFKNVDLDAYIRLFEASAYLEAGSARPWKNFVDEVETEGFKVNNGQMSFGVAHGDLGSIRIKQFDHNITDFFDKSASNAGFASQNPEEARQIASAIRSAFAVESFAVRDVIFSAPNKSGIANASLKAASLSNLTAAHADQLAFDTLNVTDPGGAINIGKLEFKDINIPPPANSMSTPNAPDQLLQSTVPTVGNLMAEGLDIRVGGSTYGFEQLGVAMSYFIGATPTNVKATLAHLKFPADQVAIPNVKQELLELGYNQVDLSLTLAGAWQDSSSALAFDSIKLTGADMGTLSLSGSLTGITRASFEDPRTVLPAEILAGGLRNFRLSYADGSLFDRFIGQVAKQNNKSNDDLKKILSANMPAILAQIPSTKIRNNFILAAVSFINNPKILDLITTTSEVTPIQDILAALQRPAMLPGVLKLDASANERK